MKSADQPVVKEAGSRICQRTVGEHSKSGIGRIAGMNRAVRAGLIHSRLNIRALSVSIRRKRSPSSRPVDAYLSKGIRWVNSL